jgi:glycosyltransferase involved in cell wall biosynthesis
MQVVLSLSPGGTERLVVEIVRRLRHSKIESVVCCLDTPGEWAPELTRIGVRVIALNRQPGFHPSLGRRLARVAAQYDVPVLHCHQYSSFVYGQIAALYRPSLRVVFTEHGRLNDAPPSSKRRLVNPVLGCLPARIFAVSNDLRRHMIAEGFPARRVEVLYNGIATGAVPSEEERKAIRNRLGLGPDTFVIGTIARLDPVKDLGTLIEAFAGVSDRYRTRLVIVGSGNERDALESKALACGVAGRVMFAGHRDDARSILAGFDLFVNCSISEGISLTILEAMAAQVPIVATEVGGNPEVVSDGETGLLVPARTPGALTDAILSLMESRRARPLAIAGRRRLERMFAIDRMLAGYTAAYDLAGLERSEVLANPAL